MSDYIITAKIEDGKPRVEVADDVDAHWLGTIVGMLIQTGMERGLDPVVIQQQMGKVIISENG